MSTVLDQWIALGEEAAYGTAVALTRSYEARDDEFTRNVAYATSPGFRAGQQTTLANRHKVVTLGAAGKITVPLLTRGMGLLLKHTVGAAATVDQQASSAAYLQEFDTSTAPVGSYTCAVARVDTAGNLQQFNYPGTVATGWELAADAGGDLTFAVMLDSQSEATVNPAAAAPDYPAGDLLVWEDLALSLGGDTLDEVTGIALTVDHGLKTDRHYLRGASKKKPLRTGVPTLEGTLTAHFEDLDRYNDFVAGTQAELVVTVTGPTPIEAGYDTFFKVTCPKIQFTGTTPKASVGDLTAQELPFVVLHDPSQADPALTIQYQSADTAW